MYSEYQVSKHHIDKLNNPEASREQVSQVSIAEDKSLILELPDGGDQSPRQTLKEKPPTRESATFFHESEEEHRYNYSEHVKKKGTIGSTETLSPMPETPEVIEPPPNPIVEEHNEPIEIPEDFGDEIEREARPSESDNILSSHHVSLI